MKIKRYKKDEDYSYTLGITLTIELLKQKPNLVQMVYLHSSFHHNETYELIKELTEQHQIPIEVNDKVFNILSRKENCYVIGIFNKFEAPIKSDEPHLVLVNPGNAGNLGTIIRTMVGFRMNDLVVITPGVDLFDPKVVRASMGAVFHINFAYFDSFIDYQKKQSERAYFPFMLTGAKPLSSIQPKGQYSLIFGNEATGLPEEFLNIGQSVVIPHSEDIDSLNLPIAVSIAMYQVTKEKFL